MATKQTTLRLDDYLYQRLEVQASAERRSVNSTVIVALERYLEDVELESEIHRTRRTKEKK